MYCVMFVASCMGIALLPANADVESTNEIEIGAQLITPSLLKSKDWLARGGGLVMVKIEDGAKNRSESSQGTCFDPRRGATREESMKDVKWATSILKVNLKREAGTMNVYVKFNIDDEIRKEKVSVDAVFPLEHGLQRQLFFPSADKRHLLAVRTKRREPKTRRAKRSHAIVAKKSKNDRFI